VENSSVYDTSALIEGSGFEIRIQKRQMGHIKIR